MSSVNAEAALEVLKKQFTVRLRDKVKELQQLLNDCRPDSLSGYSDKQEPLIKLHRVVHSLIGAAGSFKLNDVSQKARQLETIIKSHLEEEKPPSEESWLLMNELLGELDSKAQTESISLPVYETAYPVNRDSPPLVYVVENDLEQAELIAQLLDEQGYDPRIFTELDGFREVIRNNKLPDALILDMAFPEGNTAGAKLLGEIKKIHETCPPVVFVSAMDDFQARLAAIRAGASRYLVKPVMPEVLVGVLESLTGRQPPEPHRVLIIDDDSMSLDIHERILTSAGIEVMTLQQPERVYDIIEQFKPDVLLLDVFMPEASGPELAAILREQDDYLTMPIIFVSVDGEADDKSKTLLTGGDQFLEKPVEPMELVASVTARAKRFRQNTAMQRRLKSVLYERNREHFALNHHALVSIADIKGNITYANDEFCRISGYSKQELLGQNHRIVKSGYHEPEFYRDLWQTIAAGDVWEGDICNRRKDGQFYWVHSTITPFMDDNGKPYQYVSIRTDITSLKESEEEQRQQNTMRSTLAQIAGKLFKASLDNLDEVITDSLELVCQQLGNTCGTIFIFDTETQTFKKRYEWCDIKAPAHSRSPETLSPTDIPWWWSQIEQGKPIYIPDVRVMHPSAIQEQTRLKSMDVKSVYGFPVRINQGLLGFLCLHNTENTKNEFKSKVELLGLMGELIASAMVKTDSQAEAEQAKERLRLGQLYANIGTWEWNIKTGELFWTERIAPMFGLYDERSVVSFENFMSAVHPDDRALITDKVNACIEKDEPYDVEHRVVWPDGTERWLLERGSVERDNNGDAIKMIGVVQDISDRKHAEVSLTERESQLLEAQRLASIGHWQANVKTGEVSWSKEIFHIFGQSPASFTPSVEAFHKSVHPDDRELVNESESAAVETGKHDVVHRIIRPDGIVRHVHELAEMELDEHGNPELMTGTVQDITDRVLYEQRLQIFKHVIDVVVDGVIIINTRGVIQQVNPAACKIFGYLSDELEGRKLNVLMPEPHATQHDNYIYKYLDTHEAHVIDRQIEVMAKKSDGSLFPMEVAVSELKTQGELKFVGLLRDISERKRIEKELMDATQTAEKANKAKSEFLSSMSHELRTPLNAILGFAQLMEYDGSISELQKDNLKEIIKAGSHLLDLINEVLDLAKIEAGKIELSIEPVEVSAIIEQCFSLVKPLAEKNDVEIQHNLVEEIMVMGDSTRLKQILLNLVSNAIKYNRQGGKVSVSIQHENNGYVRIIVDDTGYGIPKDMVGQLFQPFNRVNAEKTEIEGTGIGLTITKRLVELMSGQVGVESQEGVGSSFWVEMPMPDHRNDNELQANLATQGQLLTNDPSQTYTVLYIEDNPANLKLVKQILGQSPNIELLDAHTPNLGIEMALHHQPDLVLLDINMPGKNGYEVLKELRTNPEIGDMPVIAVTANAMLKDVEKAKKAGFNDHISKPFNIDEFLHTIYTFLRSGT